MRRMRFRRRNLPLHFMLWPAVVLVLIYSYVPMLGIVIAFQDFKPYKGFQAFFRSEWVGLDNFRFLAHMPDVADVIGNTVAIAVMKIVAGTLASIVMALLINEVSRVRLKKFIQTSIYLPYFISWVVLGGIFIDLLSPNSGIVNQLIKALGGQPIFFLGSNKWFQATLVFTDTWKNFGFGTIVYLAALTGIDPGLYEAAKIDGAGHLRQTWHVSLPGMMSIVVLIGLLNLGNLLNAGFDQVFNLYNPIVLESGDIIDTFVYRLGLVDAKYSLATAVGLFKSVISASMISVSYFLAYRYANYRVF